MVNIFSWFSRGSKAAPVEPEEVEPEPKRKAAYAGYESQSPKAAYSQQAFDEARGYMSQYWDGDKFPGGFGDTKLFTMNYWELRRRSRQLFTENLYAKGLVKRLVTNEINTGLTPESIPEESILGFPEDALADWSDDVENRYLIWAKDKILCDWHGRDTLGALVRKKRFEAIISGDVLVVCRVDRRSRTPNIQLIQGSKVQTPLGREKAPEGNTITHGVERDRNNKHVAFWVNQSDGTSKRILARGRRSGRLQAWLEYGSEILLDGVRGEPLLSVMFQSLKEVDRYRDSTVRAASLASIITAFVTKNVDRPGSLPLTGGASRKSNVATNDSDPTTPTRERKVADFTPGLIIEEMEEGEDIKFNGGQGTDVNFGTFEATMIYAIAWSNEIPPEILTLAFSNNYSASQAALNEFTIYLNLRWSIEGDTFYNPVYQSFVLAQVDAGKIDAPGLLESATDLRSRDIYGAWLQVEWYGSIKPTTDVVKRAKGSALLVEGAWSTNAREARSNTGSKFQRNVRKLKRENELKAEAMRPLLEMREAISGSQEVPGGSQAMGEALEDLEQRIEEISENVAT